ncbi:hypothetical protein [Methylobacterium ajmalii]|jgi:hypothetical protein|uniref:hypothetical protein n=1 Tax=Methylobacterium ajmalii TaxID=2738439 RepID=UPI00190D9458|nr:hypothetical protein [Methylobacterium ajmalii]MBK3400441.1 hypothetical protein [Methylobacterium ajmalii]MBK3407517.1 hypothetical protein [Methylobacterium ajmalii]MBK3422135.1 hypothetical protein [Methylobacterium ajmalii]MBZ6416652.1 hypothetical protein [Methylobacterium sp.]
MVRKLVLAAVLALAAWPALGADRPTPALDGLGIGTTALKGHIKILPNGVPAFLNAHAPSNTPQPDGIFITPSGPYVDYCSIGGCLDGPHLRSHMLINTTTKTGPDSQENALAINFTSKTGKYGRWAPSTAFATGDIAKVFGSVCGAYGGGGYQNDLQDCLYQAVAGGTTGSQGPTGNTTSYQDGSVVWKFYGPGIHDGKTALNIACNAEEGSGQIWCTNFNFSVRYKGAGTAWGEEKDCNNGNEDSSAGSRFFMACTFYGGGGPGTYPFLAHQFVGSGAVNSGSAQPYGAHAFIHIAGSPGDVGSVLKDNVILDGGNSDTTIRALSGRRHAIAFLLDESNSQVVLKATGSHAGGGLDFKGATFPAGTAIAVPTTSFIEWDGGNYIGRNAGLGAFTIGSSTSGAGYSAAAWDNGDLSYANHLWSRGNAPTLVSCGAASLVDGATDDHGVISLPTGGTGCTVNFASARQKKPACSFWMTSGQVPSGSTATVGIVLAFSAVPAATELQYQCRGR